MTYNSSFFYELIYHFHFSSVYRPLISSRTNVPKPLQDLIQVAEEMKVDMLRQTVDTDTFQMFAEIFLKNIVPKRSWRLKHRRENIRYFVTAADESLALLILENNIYEWMDSAFTQANSSVLEKEHTADNGDGHNEQRTGMGSGRGEDEQRAMVGGEPQKKKRKKKTLYTHGGMNSDGTKKGWSAQGIRRYNEIMRKVMGFRADNRYTAVEDELQKRWKESGKDTHYIVQIQEADEDEDVEEALTEFDFE